MHECFYLYFSVYMAFLIMSSILLTITICVYTYYTKLLNDYTRLMRHYAFVLNLAFVVMTINKDNTFSNELCQFNGKEKSQKMVKFYKSMYVCIIILLGIYGNFFLFVSGLLLQYLFVASFSFMSSLAIFTWSKIQ